MAERIERWPRGRGAWETGFAPAPEPPPASTRCACGAVKGPRWQKCRRCYLAEVAEQRDRIRVMLATHRAREVAAILGVSLDTVYRARHRRR